MGMKARCSRVSLRAVGSAQRTLPDWHCKRRIKVRWRTGGGIAQVFGEMKACCSRFDDFLLEAGKAGYSVIVRRLGDRIGFFLQSRACDFEQIDKIVNGPRVDASLSPCTIRLAAATRIRYCPYCGRELSQVIESWGEHANELASRHKPYEQSISDLWENA